MGKVGQVAPRYPNGKKIAILAGIGAACRAQREALGVSQRELARRLGVSDGAISKLEEGTIVPVWLLLALAVEWDCTLDDLAPVSVDG